MSISRERPRVSRRSRSGCPERNRTKHKPPPQKKADLSTFKLRDHQGKEITVVLDKDENSFLLDPKSPFFWWWLEGDNQTDFNFESIKKGDPEFRLVMRQDAIRTLCTRELRGCEAFVIEYFCLWQRAAFHWEIARRADRAWGVSLPAWPDLPVRVRRILIKEEKSPDSVIWGKVHKKDWTFFTFSAHDHASYAQIGEAAIDFAKYLSHEKHIQRPRGPKLSNRHITWRWVMLMDESELAKEPLDGKDRKALSEGRKEGQRQVKRLRALLQKHNIQLKV